MQWKHNNSIFISLLLYHTYKNMYKKKWPYHNKGVPESARKPPGELWNTEIKQMCITQLRPDSFLHFEAPVSPFF